MTRDMKKVPPSPDQVRLRTGDRVRIEVGSRPARVLDRLQRRPDRHSEPALPRRRSSARQPAATDRAQPAAAHRQRRDDAAGRPRAAVRRLDPPAAPLRLDQLHSLVERKNGDSPASRPYVATRDMKRVQQSVQQLRPEDWHAVVLELDHGP